MLVLCTRCNTERPQSDFYDPTKRRCKECEKARYRDRRRRNPVKYRLFNAFARARKLGIPYEHEIEHLDRPEACPCCGADMTEFGPREHAPTLDRIIPEDGYTVANTIILCSRCNRWKSDMHLRDLERLRAFVARVLEERGLAE